MIYCSQVTEKGNLSHSYISQEDAEAKAADLDAKGCSNCWDCSYCWDCSGEVIQAGRPNSWPCYGWLKEGKLIIHCGCRKKTYSEAVEYWSNKIDRTEVLAAVEYIATIAKQRGWAI